MPETPAAYKKRYLPINFDSATGRKHIFVMKYRSSFSGNEFRKAALKDLRHFIKKEGRFEGGANGATHEYEAGIITSPLLRPTNTSQIDLSILKVMFQGVGRPSDFLNVLRAADLYLQCVEMDDDQLKKMGWGHVIRDHQEYTNYYLGLDCRGFVGAYLRENYPNVKDTAKDMSFLIDAYNGSPGNFHENTKGGSFTRIDDPREIRQGDLLLKCDNGDGKRHVAIVETAGTATKMRVHVKTTESRGGIGLCHKYDDLRRTSTTWKDGANDRNWKHYGTLYNFVLRPKL